MKFGDIYKLKLDKFIHDLQQDVLPLFFANYFLDVCATQLDEANLPVHELFDTYLNDLSPNIKPATKCKFKKAFENYVFSL